MAFDPWKILEEFPEIELSWGELNTASAMSDGHDIVMDLELLQVEQRCSLAHELVHISRGHRVCQPISVETRVRDETAKLLVSFADLKDAVRWSSDFSEVADELSVTESVLRDRLRTLSDQQRMDLRLCGDYIFPMH